MKVDFIQHNTYGVGILKIKLNENQEIIKSEIYDLGFLRFLKKLGYGWSRTEGLNDSEKNIPDHLIINTKVKVHSGDNECIQVLR